MIYLTFFPPNECKLEETKQESQKARKRLTKFKEQSQRGQTTLQGLAREGI